MKLGQSRIDARGQVLVPAEVLRRLGLVPGSTVGWHDEGTAVVMRRGERHTSKAVHDVLFPEGSPPRRSLSELKEGVRAEFTRRGGG